MTQIQLVFALLIVFQIKHFVADYPLQTQYMLGKFKAKAWLLPLTAHAGVHAGITFLITAPLIGFTRGLVLGFFDFAVHFGMDRVRASPDLLGRFKPMFGSEHEAARYDVANWETIRDGVPRLPHDLLPSGLSDYFELSRRRAEEALKRLRHNTLFWWALGLDQGVHHLTHYVIIALVVTT
jgi:hypothetical protein